MTDSNANSKSRVRRPRTGPVTRPAVHTSWQVAIAAIITLRTTSIGWVNEFFEAVIPGGVDARNAVIISFLATTFSIIKNFVSKQRITKQVIAAYQDYGFDCETDNKGG